MLGWSESTTISVYIERDSCHVHHLHQLEPPYPKSNLQALEMQSPAPLRLLALLFLVPSTLTHPLDPQDLIPEQLRNTFGPSGNAIGPQDSEFFLSGRSDDNKKDTFDTNQYKRGASDYIKNTYDKIKTSGQSSERAAVPQSEPHFKRDDEKKFKTACKICNQSGERVFSDCGPSKRADAMPESAVTEEEPTPVGEQGGSYISGGRRDEERKQANGRGMMNRRISYGHNSKRDWEDRLPPDEMAPSYWREDRVVPRGEHSDKRSWEDSSPPDDGAIPYRGGVASVVPRGEHKQDERPSMEKRVLAQAWPRELIEYWRKLESRSSPDELTFSHGEEDLAPSPNSNESRRAVLLSDKHFSFPRKRGYKMYCARCDDDGNCETIDCPTSATPTSSDVPTPSPTRTYKHRKPPKMRRDANEQEAKYWYNGPFRHAYAPPDDGNDNEKRQWDFYLGRLGPLGASPSNGRNERRDEEPHVGEWWGDGGEWDVEKRDEYRHCIMSEVNLTGCLINYY